MTRSQVNEIENQEQTSKYKPNDAVKLSSQYSSKSDKKDMVLEILQTD